MGVVDVVRRDQDRPPRLPQVGEDAPDSRGRCAVEPAERLVQKEHARLAGQGARDEDPLALAARKLAEKGPGLSFQPNQLERLVGAPTARQREPAVPRRIGIGAHRRDVERRDGEVEPCALGLRDVGDTSLDLDGAGAARKLAKERPEEARLAATVRPQHGDDLARVNMEVDLGDRI